MAFVVDNYGVTEQSTLSSLIESSTVLSKVGCTGYQTYASGTTLLRDATEHGRTFRRHQEIVGEGVNRVHGSVSGHRHHSRAVLRRSGRNALASDGGKLGRRDRHIEHALIATNSTRRVIGSKLRCDRVHSTVF